jgi:hypothetical protein
MENVNEPLQAHPPDNLLPREVVEGRNASWRQWYTASAGTNNHHYTSFRNYNMFVIS